MEKKLFEMLTGKLLGDGNLTIQKGRKSRLRFSHSIYDKDWCFYCYTKLRKYLPINEPKYIKIKDPRVSKGYTEQYYVQSKTDPILCYLKDLWYENKTKVIPKEFIKLYLSPLALGWWYLDDGHLKLDNNGTPIKIILSTDSFTKEENFFLIQLLREKFELRLKLDKQNRLILYDKPQIFYFLKLIKPHLQYKMERKFIQQTSYKKVNTDKRTTIYLPENLNISKPTEQINLILKQNVYFIKNKLNNLISYKKIIIKYHNFQTIPKESFKPYTFVIWKDELNELLKLKTISGFTFSFLTYLCIDK